MATPEKPGKRFQHRKQRDPLQNQKPGIGKQPYRGDETDERSSLGDQKSNFGNREREAGL